MQLMAIALGILFVTSATHPLAAQGVSFIGVNPVQLGMTVDAAEQALQAEFAPISIPFSDECWITRRADGKAAALSYVIQNGKITRIDFDPLNNLEASPTTTKGIGIGSTEADIGKEYGAVLVSRAPYDDRESETEAAKYRAEHGVATAGPPPHYWFRVDSPDHKRGIVFVTQAGKITSLMTGYKDAIENVEICR